MALSRSARITILLVIDIVFFFVELIVGMYRIIVSSVALTNSSDVMSLIVALYAIKLTANSSADSRYSYGWHRAEILAALVNGVFLLALCFTIFLEAIERFFSTPDISNPKLVIIVGSLGLASNIVGLFLFHEHTHSHSHPPSKATSRRPSSSSITINGNTPTLKSPQSTSRSRSASQSEFSTLYGHPVATRAALVQQAQDLAAQNQSTGSLVTSPLAEGLTNAHATENTPLLPNETEHSHSHGHSHGSMNMRALVLHVIGDALGNVGVISTGLVIWLTQWSFKYYFDPMISLLITVIIFSSALPLVQSASFILLQGVPPTISLDSVRGSILDVEGVLSVHELHVWQLSESKVIASVHVLASRDHDFMPIAVKIRKALHHHGIHSSTIQPEYLCAGVDYPEEIMRSGDNSCLVLCPPDQACDPAENACCRE
ncbi:hypothetical protein H0H87_003834 [Tephrocybe sp. NHM501043]|nr:hypothetical protein H0H87_003834 [Tephrocybe sp. NHM501043]